MPDLMPKVQVDKGAIKFVLNGAEIMCPGLISKGGVLPAGLDKGIAVAVYAEGKRHALAIGVMAMSSDEM
jgi:PUA domain protein